MNGNLQNYAISSIAMHPTNPDILYVGTGEGFEYNDSLRGDGIFKTTDGGMTWTRLPGTRPEPPPDDFPWSSVNRISIDPNDGNKILAAISGGIARSTDGGTSWTIVRTAVKSLHVAFDPMNSNKAVGEIQEGTGSNTIHRVVYSINGGLNWQNSLRDGNPFITTGLGYLNGSKRIELAFSRRPLPIINPVYALYPEGIARSDDGGATFTTKSTIALGGVSIYFNTLWVSPVNDNFVIAGGLQLHRSTDGGASFTQISNGNILDENPVKPHTDQHCIVPHPGFDGGSNKIVYVCNDGGVYLTSDITTASINSGWQRKYLTYQTTQYYGVAGNGATGMIYGGAQDNGTLRLLSGSQNAGLFYVGDGGFAAIDPTGTGDCYGEHYNLRIHRLDNCNTTPSSAVPIFDTITDAGDDKMSNFIAPFILDPNDPKRMLAGGRSLWRSDGFLDVSLPPNFSKIRAGDPNRDNTDENISAIAVKQGTADDSNIIWIGQNNGKIYKTTTGLAMTPNWMPVDDNVGTNPLPNRVATRILIDKDNSDIVYVAFGGFSGDNLWRTNNGGTYWEDITGAGLPPAPIRGIARHPTIPNKLYIGTEIGVFASDNTGTTWNAVLDGPANVSVDEVVFMSGNSTTLLAATHGRGVWTANVAETQCTTRTLFDFDCDGRSDLSVFRPSDTNWYLDRSIAGSQVVQFGVSSDKPVARDYDGDGKADITVWRASDGTWHRLNSSNGAYVVVQFGQNGDVPLPADFDGDGKADQAVFRPSTGVWHLNQSAAGYTSVSWGVSSDLPSATDFDGDGKADLAMFRPSTGVWYLLQSTSGTQYPQFGQNGDVPVPADYDGDGKADLAVFRPSDSKWYLNRSTAGLSIVQYGVSSDKLVPADYDGDGKADIAIWRPSDGNWYLLQSANGQKIVHFGGSGDIPIAAMP